jgi:hypothetical protein
MDDLMSENEQPYGDSASPIERFIKDFFGLGNITWPDQDADSNAGRTVRPYLDVLWQREDTEVPVVLPRRREKGGDLTAYVIARDPAHAVVVADLLTAFVGPTFSSFDGLPARLDPSDPVDRAVLEFTGDGLAFTVTSPTKGTQSEAWKALDLLRETLRQRPVRTWHVRKPVGRLLGEFEVALAAGDNSVSGDLLDQIAVVGGLSPANLANLKIKRLARLGRDAELLRLPGLADVVLSRPPTPIRDAILAAIYGTSLAAPLEAGDLQVARHSLVSAGTFVLPLLDGPAGLVGLSGEALAVAALTADIRDDARLLAAVLLDPHRHKQVARVTPLLARVLTPTPAPDASADTTPVPAAVPVDTSVEPEADALWSWLELVAALSAGSADVTAVLASQDWEEWNPPADEDQAIADTLAGLGDEAASRAWLVAGPVIDADGYDRPAAQTARQLIEIALLNDRFSPGDLSGIVALADIFLRSGPDEGAYVSLLDDLEDESNRWVGPERATVVLDLVDLLVRAACPDDDARLRLALALLRPLRDQDGRLEPEQARFARQLNGELQVGLEWPARDETSQENSLPDIPATQVLLYSLDERVLERTKTLLGEIAPKADVRLSHEKVGSQSLKQQARGAEVIVMATRCAKHAATGFIRQHASSTSVVAEADGSGSASLLRAVIAALRARTGQ